MADRMWKYEAFPSSAQADALDFRFTASRSLYNEAVAWERSLPRFDVKLSDAIAGGVQGADFTWHDERYPYALVPAAILHGAIGAKGDLPKAIRAVISTRTGGKAADLRFRSRLAEQSVTWQVQENGSKATPASLVTWNGGRRAAFRIPNARGIKDGPAFFPGYLKIEYHRPLPDDALVNAVRVKRDLAGRFWIFLQVETEKVKEPAATGAVGIDRGIVNTAVLSDGRVFDVPSLTEGERKRLLRLRQQMARQRRVNRCPDKSACAAHSCWKTSKRYQRAKTEHARLLARAGFRAADAEHKASRVLADEFSLVVVEDLGNLKSSRSARGTAESPGTRVAQKTGLNREQRANRWGSLEQRIAEKTAIEKVNPRYTSQTCSACGIVDKSFRSGKSFRCGNCGLRMDADHNAAVNILARSSNGAALALSARGDLCGPQAQGTSVNRETPTSLVPGYWGVSVARTKVKKMRSDHSFARRLESSDPVNPSV